jgi:competence protein ComEC
MPGIAPRSVVRGDHRLLITALAALVVIQLGYYWHVAWFGIGAFGGLAWGWAKSTWRWPAAVLVLALLHAAWLHWQQAQQRWPQPESVQSEYRVLAVQPAPDRTRMLLQDAQGRRLRVAAYAENAQGLSGLPIHSCIQARLRLKPPHGTVNWAGFDYGRWLYSQGIDGIGSLQHWRSCLDTAPAVWPAPAPSGPGMALQRALVYADRSGFSREIWDTLARTGVSHLFAISGLHLGMLGAWGWGLGAALWAALPGCQRRFRRRQLAAISSALWMSAYMLLAHAQVSAWRAWSMGMLALGLVTVGRAASPLAGWSLALLGVLLISPLHSLHASLWLSFSAVLLLLVAWPWLRPCSWPLKIVAMQALLGLGLAPLCWAWFSQWSVIGLGLNLLLVPAMTIILPLCLCAALVRALSGWPLPQEWLAQALDYLYAGLSWGSGKPWAAWSASSLNLLEAALLLACLVMVIRLGPQRRLLAALGLLAWSAALGVALRPLPAPKPGSAQVWVLDVGQGAAAVVRTAKRVVVIDSGPRSRSGRFDAGAMIVKPQLEALGLRQIDLLITTHEDRDHAGGRSALEQEFKVVEQWGEAGRSCQEPQQWHADGVVLSSLSFGRPAHWSKNNLSCVVLLQVGPLRMLFPGDVEAPAEAATLAHPWLQDGVDVVLVPHHGSQTSSTAEWIALLRASLAIVPAGSYNRWGFPRPQVVHRWESAGSSVLTTAAGGAVLLQLPKMHVQRPAARPWRLEAL